jgi:hypothetical protein
MKWIFPSNNGGEVDGFNNASIDTFNGTKLFSVVRETIQNSMDARLDKSKPVRVSFSLSDIEKSKAVGINELVPFLQGAGETARSQQSDTHSSVKFFEHAVQSINSAKTIPVFTISDFNTCGLEGDYDDTDPKFKGDKWYALIKGSGLSQKATDGALGSFGHGSKAPFAASSLRTVFYFSQISKNGKIESRFQGKSILQSIRMKNSIMTQGTGYFSSSDKCDPIFNSNIPTWIKNLRDSSGKGTGTSIVVPFPDLGSVVENFWQEMQISIIHNFYLAIKNKNLEVDFNGKESLNSTNLVTQFEKLIKDLLTVMPEGYEEKMASLECAKTIEFFTPEKSGVLKSKPFGRISWYMRTGDDVSWRGVGIARQNGMLITETPQGLMKFPGTKPFDLFLCVEGESGSRILRSIEDPSHTKFEFDRIPDLEERYEAEIAYKTFIKEVRQLILEHAAMDASEEEFINDLDEFFSGAESTTVNDGNAEISNKLTLDPIRRAKPLRPSNVGTDSGQGGSDDQVPQPTPGAGMTEVPGGTSAVDFAGAVGSNGKKFELSLGDARIVHTEGKTSKFYFNLDHAGAFSLSIGKIGELESELLKYRTTSDPVWKSKRVFHCKKKGSRVSIEVELEPGAEKYALQLVANIV